MSGSSKTGLTQPSLRAEPAGYFRTKKVRYYQPPERLLPWSYMEQWVGGKADAQIKVAIHRSTLDEIYSHAASDKAREQFGILLGSVYRDPTFDGNWVEISGIVSAERVQATRAHVEVSAEEMSRLNERVDQILHRTEGSVRKIGWYHSHIGIGVFMSSIDRENQESFYNAGWHIALVIDPIKKEWDVFSGPDCQKVSRNRLSVVPDSKAMAAGSLCWTKQKIGPPSEKVKTPDAIDLRTVGPVVNVRTLGMISLAIIALLGLILLWQRRQNRDRRHSAQQALLVQVEAVRSGRKMDMNKILEVIVKLDPKSEVGDKAQKMRTPTVTVTPTPEPIATATATATPVPEPSASVTDTLAIPPAPTAMSVLRIIQPGDTLVK
jgi:proteasome lid subunit RPN8/RPN11